MKIKLLFALSLISFRFLSAAEPADVFSRGNQMYQSGRYQEAVQAYQSLVNGGWSGEELFFNLGNAYYKINRLGLAILYYEKALKLDPNDEDIQYNLRMANARTIDKLETIPDIFLVKWWKSLLNAFSVNGWTTFSYLVYLAFLVFIAFYYLAGRAVYQKWAVMGGAVILFLLIFSVIMLSLKYNNDHNLRNGIVTQPAVYAKLSPDTSSRDAFIIHEGLKVDLEDKVSGWVKIKLADGKVGWIEESHLGSI